MLLTHRSLARFWLCLALAAAAASSPRAQVSAQLCGPVWGTNHFGPWDYRKPQGNLGVVERAHFTLEVEQLIRGKTGPIGSDLNYTLRSFPNHHRALVAATRLAKRYNKDQPNGMEWTLECYFERALRFASDDFVVRGLYAQWLVQQGRRAEAEAQLAIAVDFAKDAPAWQYAAGLIYLELGDHERALSLAHRALKLGWQGHELKDRLVAAGRWRDPQGAAAAGASAAGTGQTPTN